MLIIYKGDSKIYSLYVYFLKKNPCTTKFVFCCKSIFNVYLSFTQHMTDIMSFILSILLYTYFILTLYLCSVLRKQYTWKEPTSADFFFFSDTISIVSCLLLLFCVKII